jgi:hypothetical protein
MAITATVELVATCILGEPIIEYTGKRRLNSIYAHQSHTGLHKSTLLSVGYFIVRFIAPI